VKPGHDYGCFVHAFVLVWTVSIGYFVVDALRNNGDRVLATISGVLLFASIPAIYKLADYLGDR